MECRAGWGGEIMHNSSRVWMHFFLDYPKWKFCTKSLLVWGVQVTLLPSGGSGGPVIHPQNNGFNEVMGKGPPTSQIADK